MVRSRERADLSSNEPSRERSTELQIDALLAGRLELLRRRGVAVEAMLAYAERLRSDAPDAAAIYRAEYLPPRAELQLR